MLYTEFNVGGKEYKLRLNTRATIALEKKLNGNPLHIFTGASETNLPTFEEMVTILHASLQAFHHNISLDDTYVIFDEWLDEGHTGPEFVAVIVEIYKVSGLIKRDTNEKN